MPLRLLLVALALAAAIVRGEGAATNIPPDPDAVLRELGRMPGNPVSLDQLLAAIPKMTNARMREVSLAVYGLGSLINGERARAQQARDALARDYPLSESLRLLRADALSVPCPRCGGEGHARREFCDTCKGSRHCQVCGGKGKLRALSGTAECTACNGSGRCKACEGTGRKQTPCARCGGEGRVLDIEEIRRTSNALLHEYLSGVVP